MQPGISSIEAARRGRGRTLAGGALAVALITLAGCDSGGGGGVADGGLTEALLRWNQVAVDASGLDHTPSNQGPPHIFGQQVGPCRSSRAMAIVHIAMLEAANAIDRKFESYVGLPTASPTSSARAAVAQAAHDTLVSLYPSQVAILDAALLDDLNAIPPVAGKFEGIAVGIVAAAAILQDRANDGSNHPEPRVNIDFFPGMMPGQWRQDPISNHPLALGGQWASVLPFVTQSNSQFRCPVPPSLTSAEYTGAYVDVESVGGDGIITPTTRTEEQTLMGLYWAYDGTPSLCAPPRLYNQITRLIASIQGTEGIDLARLLALANVSMADAGMGAWESKYFYQYWRPVTGIRESDPGTGPTGFGDGNPATVGDVTCTPLGAPASNLSGPNFTPPFPAYPSGHATFGGALFQTLRRFYGTDNIAFTFVSDELNGVTVDNMGNPRPLLPRSFTTLSQAEEENGQSRIYLGIHWVFDKTAGIDQGNLIGDYVFDNAFRPLP